MRTNDMINVIQKKILAWLILPVLILGSSCSKKHKTISNENGEIFHETVEYPVKKEYIENTIEIPGTVSFVDKATISTSITNGILTSLRKDVGDSVYANEILAELDKDRINLELTQAENGLASAKAQYELTLAKYENAKQAVKKKILDLEKEKASLLSLQAEYENSKILLQNKKELLKIGGITESDYNNFMTQNVSIKAKYFSAFKEQEKNAVGFRNEDLKEAGFGEIKDRATWEKYVIENNTKIELGELRVSESALKNASSQVELAKLHLKEATIRSPIQGVVAEKGFDKGEMIKPDTPIYTIVNVNEIYVTSSVSEEKLVLLRKGQTGEFNVDAIPDKLFKGTVQVISPVIDPKSRMAEVRVKVRNTPPLLKPGMFVRLKIILDSKTNAFAIPADSFTLENIAEKNGNKKENTDKRSQTKNAFCYIIKDGKSYKKSIVIGQKFNDKFQVLDGLKEGDILASTNIDSLQDGSLIYHKDNSSHENETKKKAKNDKKINK